MEPPRRIYKITYLDREFSINGIWSAANDGRLFGIRIVRARNWANIRKISNAPEGVRHLSFKSQEYTAG